MNKFLTSVADVYGYDDANNLLFVGKTLLDTSIETTLGNTDVRAGRGNQLQYIYYHTAEMNINISDAQWNLDFLAVNIGSSVTTGNNIYKEENVTLGALGAGTVTGTPLAVSGSTIYGWVKLVNGTVEKVTFTGSNFTCGGTSGDVVCVRYYALNSAARSITITSSILPSIVRLVLEAQLNSSDVATNKIGTVQIIVPKATMTGAFTISMTPDGVASTPLTARALAFTDTSGGCTSTPQYAKIIEIMDNVNWYDSVVALAIVGGDFALTGTGTKQLEVRAIPSTGAAFKPPYADLTFSSSAAVAVVDAAGLVDVGTGTGTATIKATITAKTDIDANVICTVS